MKQIKTIILMLLLSSAAQAGNFSIVHFKSTQDVTSKISYLSSTLATNLPGKTVFKKDQEYVYEFDDRSSAQNSYIELTIKNQNEEVVCEIEITPASFNRQVAPVVIRNMYNTAGQYCETTRWRADDYLYVTSSPS